MSILSQVSLCGLEATGRPCPWMGGCREQRMQVRVPQVLPASWEADWAADPGARLRCCVIKTHLNCFIA